MVLYNNLGRAQFFSVEETTRYVINIYEFDVRRQAFSKDPEAQAHSLLKDIIKIRQQIPLELRLSLPSLRLSDRSLCELERECKKYITP